MKCKELMVQIRGVLKNKGSYSNFFYYVDIYNIQASEVWSNESVTAT